MSFNKKPPQLVELETLTVLAAVFLVLNVFFHQQVFIYGAILLLVTGLFIKPLASMITKAWLKFSCILGAINTKIILSLVFFLILTPLAYLFRLFNKNPLQLAKKSKSQSLYHDRNYKYVKSDFEKMW